MFIDHNTDLTGAAIFSKIYWINGILYSSYYLINGIIPTECKKVHTDSSCSPLFSCMWKYCCWLTELTEHLQHNRISVEFVIDNDGFPEEESEQFGIQWVCVRAAFLITCRFHGRFPWN